MMEASTEHLNDLFDCNHAIRGCPPDDFFGARQPSCHCLGALSNFFVFFGH